MFRVLEWFGGSGFIGFWRGRNFVVGFLCDGSRYFVRFGTFFRGIFLDVCLYSVLCVCAREDFGWGFVSLYYIAGLVEGFVEGLGFFL